MSLTTQKLSLVSLPRNAWLSLQLVLWLIGALVVALLLVKPYWGLNLFWNLIIPIAPALLVLIPGVWRNICPMASTALLPKKL